MSAPQKASNKGKRVPPPLSGPLPKYTRAPLSDLPIKKSGPRRSSSSRFNEKSRAKLERLPGFHEVPEGQRQDLLVQKIRQCCVVFDFTNPLSDAESKELKREILKELVDYIADPANNTQVLSTNIYSEVFHMIAVNLFRPLPPHINPSGPAYDPEEDEPILEEAWPHLRIVYKFFLHFLESPAFDTSRAQGALSTSWLQQLLALFDSEDPRERDYLKTTLHRIYGRFLEYRAFIRQQICHIFYTFIYETERHNGIAELLEILGTIIHGFALPLKAEHIGFLKRALLPLHKVHSAGIYFPQLAYCVYQFLEKDPSLTSLIFKSILKHWPAVNSPKELMFISEVEELLTIVEEDQLDELIVPLFKRLASCMCSPHFQVAEKTLGMWRKKKVLLETTRDRLHIVLPIVYGPLYTNSKKHWHRAVKVMSLNALRLFMEMDNELFAQCTAKFRKDFIENKKKNEERNQMWAVVERLADSEDTTGPALSIPSPSGGTTVTSSVTTETEGGVDDVIRALTDSHKTREKTRPRRKSLLPIDALTLEALQSHIGLDESVNGQNARRPAPLKPGEEEEVDDEEQEEEDSDEDYSEEDYSDEEDEDDDDAEEEDEEDEEDY